MIRRVARRVRLLEEEAAAQGRERGRGRRLWVG